MTLPTIRPAAPSAGAAHVRVGIVFDIPFADFVHRALRTQERVQFSQLDAYGHLATAQYVNLYFDHRMQVVKDLLSVDLGAMLKHQKLAFFLKDIRYQFGMPCSMGDAIEVTSWVERYSERDQEQRCIVVGQEDRLVRANAVFTFVCVNLETGKKAPMPLIWPSSADRNLSLDQPSAADYLATVKNPPADWVEAVQRSPG